ncbi:hypothetical protein BJI67_15925 (plasmid) [Acidihalobacter aeolianus]|uniref:Uncharacterized protein n=2 Tax=Acidihalobacter aeolianus TaxID=2792603 RepID=A0A1D8KCQ3_9GAMM|nr:hypothetical protein BJI67_15925 [Acidihalobacter aeolianus]
MRLLRTFGRRFVDAKCTLVRLAICADGAGAHSEQRLVFYTPQAIPLEALSAGGTLSLEYGSRCKSTILAIKARLAKKEYGWQISDLANPQRYIALVKEGQAKAAAPPVATGHHPITDKAHQYLQSQVSRAESILAKHGYRFTSQWRLRIEPQRSNAKRNRGGWDERTQSAVLRLGVNRGLHHFDAYRDASGRVLRKEYPSIAGSPTIGDWWCSSWQEYLTVIFLHEFAHGVQRAPASSVGKPGDGLDYDKPHGEGWQRTYELLRLGFGLVEGQRSILAADNAQTTTPPAMSCKTFNGWLEKAGLPKLTQLQYERACEAQPSEKIADAARKACSVTNARLYLERLLSVVGVQADQTHHDEDGSVGMSGHEEDQDAGRAAFRCHAGGYVLSAHVEALATDHAHTLSLSLTADTQEAGSTGESVSLVLTQHQLPSVTASLLGLTGDYSCENEGVVLQLKRERGHIVFRLGRLGGEMAEVRADMPHAYLMSALMVETLKRNHPGLTGGDVILLLRATVAQVMREEAL